MPESTKNQKDSLITADFANDKVLPFFDENKIKVHQTLTDRSGKYYGKIESNY